MNNEDMLAKLVRQASAEGCSLITLRAIVEEAAELGATRALERQAAREAYGRANA